MLDTSILHLSDIHLGSDYDGLYNTNAQFDEVINKAASSHESYNAVIVTGDLADSTNEDRSVLASYRHIFETLSDFSNNVYVTPGNHDNRALLQRAYCDVFPSAEAELTFEKPGSDFQKYIIGGRRIVLLDSGSNEPYQGLVKMCLWRENEDVIFDMDTYVFTHKPYKTRKLFHRFMNDNMLSNEFGENIKHYTNHYFCGHLHHYATIRDGSSTIHLCPAVQCMIDPYSAECHPSSMFGYQVIRYDSTDKHAAPDVMPFFCEVQYE